MIHLDFLFWQREHITKNVDNIFDHLTNAKSSIHLNIHFFHPLNVDVFKSINIAKVIDVYFAFHENEGKETFK